MTLKDIAREAGVSISTVSRVINKNSTNAASKEVQDRIWEIVRRTGYTPNSTARDLKMGGSESPEPLPLDCVPVCPDRRFQVRSLFFHAGTQYRAGGI